MFFFSQIFVYLDMETLLILLFSQVTVLKDFSDEMFTSQWHYAKDIVNRETVTGTTKGHRNYDFHDKHDTSQVCIHIFAFQQKILLKTLFKNNN